VRTVESPPPRRVLKSETARAMRRYMVDVTSSIGTGWRASVEDLSLAVKTGTAQIIDPRTGSYSETDFIASCLAILPAESPSLLLYLAIIKPRGEYFGGRIAAPPIREAAEELTDYLGIPRGRNPQVSHPAQVALPPETIPVIADTVPDLEGLSKRALLPLLLRDDLQIEIQGDGWVRRQSPPPGTPIAPDTVIRVELE
ncbi:MAG: PASTA domain-containing protein, partial [Treponema sp.]|nr:PASTA domain-containing protein [Treponema sp.]